MAWPWSRTQGGGIAQNAEKWGLQKPLLKCISRPAVVVVVTLFLCPSTASHYYTSLQMLDIDLHPILLTQIHALLLKSPLMISYQGYTNMDTQRLLLMVLVPLCEVTGQLLSPSPPASPPLLHSTTTTAATTSHTSRRSAAAASTVQLLLLPLSRSFSKAYCCC